MLGNRSLQWSLILVLLTGIGPTTHAAAPVDEWDQAETCFEKADYAGAVRHLDALIASQTRRAGDVRVLPQRFWFWNSNPTWVAVFTLRADARLRQGDWDGGLADCAQAAELGSTDRDLNQIKGFCLLGRSDLEPAITAFNTVLASDPGEIYSHYGRATALLVLGRYDEARADLDTLWSLAPSPSVAQLRGALQFARRDYESALADWDEAIRREPADPANWANRSMARTMLGRHDEAMSDVNEAIRLDPKEPFGWNNRGLVEIRREQPAEAIADCTEAIRLDPEWAGKYYENRAIGRRRQNDDAGALADLDLAAKSRPNDARLVWHRALILATAADDKLRDGKRALALAQSAVDTTRGTDPDALAALAASHAELGDFPHAIAAVEAALKLSPLAPIAWRIDGSKHDQMRVGFWFTMHDPARSRRDLESALGLYHAGKPNRPA